MTKLDALEMLDKIYREANAKLRDASKLHLAKQCSTAEYMVVRRARDAAHAAWEAEFTRLYPGH